MDRPKFNLKFDSAIFRDIGSVDEVLEVNWTNPDSSSGTKSFSVGTEVFFDGSALLTDVPDEQLLACLGMAAMLNYATPGTKEFEVNMGADQEEENFQSFAGPFKLDSCRPVDNLSLGNPGEVYELVVKKTSGNQSKTFEADIFTLSDYDNVKNNFDQVALRLPAALHAEFGFEKSDLGLSGSQNRTDVLNHITNTKFWG